MFEIELADKVFKEIKDAMQSVTWEAEREKGKGQAFFLEFDGENLKILDKSGYTYFKERVFVESYLEYYYDTLDEEERESLSLPVPDPFKARINIRCLKEMLRIIEKDYDGDEGVLKVRIFTDNNRAYFQLIDRKMCGYGGMNIIAECRFKISKSK